MEGGEGASVARNRWELEDKHLPSLGGLCAGSGSQEPVNDHRRQLLRAGMRQDSRHRDACPGTKAIWKAGVGWVAEGAVGKRPREGQEGPAADRQSYLEFLGA